ncbi:MAG: hypothetical protein IH627_01690, partial [Rubrivivax sp.]|nr:hypothetical protein [Rubrivivax sp.]
MSHATPLANGPQLPVNEVIYGSQAGHRAERLADGGYVVVWVNHDGQGAGLLPADSNAAAEIRMRLFNADGSARGAEIAVNSATLGWQLDPQLAVLANGCIAVTWTDGGDFYGGLEHYGSRGVGGAAGDADGKAVKLQLFSAAGAPIGGEQLVNTTTAQSQQAARVAALADGRFVVAWEDGSLSVNSQGAGGGPGIKAQLFAADGTRIESEQAWSGDWCYAPQPMALADGGYAALWLDAYYYDPALLVVRMHDAQGGALASEVTLPIGGQGAGAQWSAAALADGGLVLAWTHRDAASGDGDGTGIRARIVSADGTPRGEAFTVNGDTTVDQEDVRLAALAG